MTSITKHFTFDAGHRLSNYDGKCKRLHGHTYLLEVTVEASISDVGFVMDFKDLKQIIQETVDERFDHRTLFKKGDELNEAIASAMPDGDDSIFWTDYNPTVENMANDIFGVISGELPRERGMRLVRVKLYETPTSFAEVTPQTSFAFNEEAFDGESQVTEAK